MQYNCFDSSGENIMQLTQRWQEVESYWNGRRWTRVWRFAGVLSYKKNPTRFLTRCPPNRARHLNKDLLTAGAIFCLTACACFRLQPDQRWARLPDGRRTSAYESINPSAKEPIVKIIERRRQSCMANHHHRSNRLLLIRLGCLNSRLSLISPARHCAKVGKALFKIRRHLDFKTLTIPYLFLFSAISTIVC